jgi:hypothetical protein
MTVHGQPIGPRAIPRVSFTKHANVKTTAPITPATLRQTPFTYVQVYQSNRNSTYQEVSPDRVPLQ